MQAQYIGDNRTITNLAPIGNENVTIELEKDKYYDINIEMDGPVMSVNNMTVVPPNNTIYIVFPNAKIPYAPDCLPKFWKGII